ncbi:RluA family pseudouridine synthase [Gorillibacterium sp. sgz5001074]|uniref:RluA family pseudouridine synthase n=1 Tax=Gorillibacterium sp. sgz5001074 TaxID=3446695 RepID=UPI003F67A87E
MAHNNNSRNTPRKANSSSPGRKTGRTHSGGQEGRSHPDSRPGRSSADGSKRSNARGFGKPADGQGRNRTRTGGRAPGTDAAASQPSWSGKAPVMIPLKAGRRKGDWYEIKLPDSFTAATASSILRFLPIPPKLGSKLLAENGIGKNGPLLKLRLFPNERPGMEPDWKEMNVLYEDDFMLIVNKPIGMEVHPSAQGQKGTLANAVAAYYEMTGQPCRVRPIHRLDKDTTGPVLFAKNEYANLVFEKAMKEKQIDRLYLAVAEGKVAQDKGVIDAPIGQDRLHSTRRRVSETGEPAVTRYEVSERLPGHTLLRLKLETGRTHQIRVHLSHIGHPIAGDGMYGGTRKYIHRQALHGEKLTCFHPWTGERIHVRAPMPDDIAGMLQQLRGK